MNEIKRKALVKKALRKIEDDLDLEKDVDDILDCVVNLLEDDEDDEDNDDNDDGEDFGGGSSGGGGADSDW